jgi:hypothetical protein
MMAPNKGWLVWRAQASRNLIYSELSSSRLGSVNNFLENPFDDFLTEQFGGNIVYSGKFLGGDKLNI